MPVKHHTQYSAVYVVLQEMQQITADHHASQLCNDAHVQHPVEGACDVKGDIEGVFTTVEEVVPDCLVE